jgi:hypothetical protein
MKSKIAFTLFSLLIAMQLAACGAVQVAPLDVFRTIDGMKAAVLGDPGTWAFTKPATDWIVLGWPAGDGRYGFALLDKLGQASPLSKVCNANVCNWRTAADFVAWLEANGWTSVPAASLPGGLIAAVRQSAFAAAIARGGPLNMLVVPMGILSPNLFEFISPKVDV